MSDGTIVEPKLSFVVRGDEGTDSIEDLAEDGRTVWKFKIAAGYDRIELRSFGEPLISLVSGSESEQWAMYGRIKKVFERRPYNLKNAIGALPEWVKLTALIGILAIVGLLGHLLHSNAFIYEAFVFYCVVSLYLWFFPSRVSFVRSHERSKRRREARNNSVSKFLWLVLGILLGSILPRVVEHFFPALKK